MVTFAGECKLVTSVFDMGLIGTALGVAGSIFGGMAASRAMKEAKEQVEKERERNDSWFDRAYNENATQRADAQRVLTMTEESIRQRNKAARARQAVTGGTEESTAAEKEASGRAMADAASRIAAAGAARKDAVDAAYRDRDAELAGELQGFETGRAGVIAGAANALASASGEMDFGTVGKKKQVDL